MPYIFYPTNKEVSAHNNIMIEKVCTSITTFAAKDYFTNIVTGRMALRNGPYRSCTPVDLQP